MPSASSTAMAVEAAKAMRASWSFMLKVGYSALKGLKVLLFVWRAGLRVGR